jgi:hypothetical protein
MNKNYSLLQVSAFRLMRHHLTGKRDANLVKVAGDVCGVQAQVINSAYTFFWSRMKDISKNEISSALYENRWLVRTMLMRQTVHIILSGDFFIYLNAVKNRNIDAMMRIMSPFGIKQKDVDKLNLRIVDALADGPLSKSELSKVIYSSSNKNMKEWMDLVGNTFKSAIFEGLVCYAQIKGNEAFFVRVDQWLPHLVQYPEEKAKQLLFKMYFRAYGPATLHDFSKWSGNLLKESERIMELVKDEFNEINYNGKKGFILTEDFTEFNFVKFKKDSLHILPGFDSYILGHAKKDHLIKLKDYKKVYRNQGWISPVILLDGEIIGTWSHRKSSKRYLIDIHLFEKLPNRIINKIEKEMAGLESFWECPCEINFNL